MTRYLVLAFPFVVWAASAQAQSYSPAARAACEPDAFRLCQQAMPDEARVRQCMVRNKRRLSPACRKYIR